MCNLHVCLNFVWSSLGQFFQSLQILPSFQGSCEDFVCLLISAQRFGLDLSAPLTQNRKDLNQLFHDPCPHKSPCCYYCLQQNHDSPSPSWGKSLIHRVSKKVGILHAAECWLLLDAPGCGGKLRSTESVIVAVYSCGNSCFLSEDWSECARHQCRCRTYTQAN